MAFPQHNSLKNAAKVSARKRCGIGRLGGKVSQMKIKHSIIFLHNQKHCCLFDEANASDSLDSR